MLLIKLKFICISLVILKVQIIKWKIGNLTDIRIQFKYNIYNYSLRLYRRISIISI